MRRGFRSHAAAVWRRSAGPAGLRRLAADAASAHRELCRQASRRHALRQRARPRHCRSAGAYGILIATPERILCERYNAFGAADRATPSWSMTKAITCTVIGRMIQEGWLASVYDPAPAPLWRDPRATHRLITLDHLLR